MNFINVFLMVVIAGFLSCQKSEFLVEEKPDVEKVVDEEKDSTVAEEDTTTMPVDDEIVKYTEYTDTSEVKLAPGFEKYLIRFGIDKDPIPNGYILHQYIKDIDSLHIGDWFDVGDENLTGIEGFTNLRIFITVSLGVKKIDFSNNSKLKSFENRGWGHCMGCGTLTSLVFGKQSKLESLSLLSRENLTDLDFQNLTKLKSLKIQSMDKLRNQDISACREIEKIELDGSAGILLGRHPKLKELSCGAYPYHVDFTKLPALETLVYGVSGRHTPDFSKNIELKNLEIYTLMNAKLDVSASKKLENLTVGGNWTQTSIDLSNNMNLKKCVLTNSQLSTICVSSLANIDFTTWAKDDQARYKVCN